MIAIDLAFLIALAVAAAGLGLVAIDRLGLRPDHPADAWALATPLGLGALSLAALGLGEAGWLGTWGLGAVLAMGLAGCGRAGWRGSAAALGSIRRGSGVGWAFDLPLLAGLIGTFAASLLPVTDGDALCYHLQVPRVFLDAGSMRFEPDLHETIYPLGVEMLYAYALALRGPVACRLVQWLLGLAFAANVAVLARPALGDRARWAAAVALLVPAVSNGMGAPLNDVALAAFGNAAIAAWMIWRDRPSARAAGLTGAMVGLAIGVKYPALVLAGLLGVGGLVLGRRRPGQAVAFGMMAMLCGGAWYLRAYAWTGNPVYPFFRTTFGGAGIDEVLDPIKRPMAATAWNLLTAIAPMTLEPARFDSFSHQWGPAFLLFVPALLWLKPPRRVLMLAGLGYAFLILCLTQRQSMRFVLIAAGPFAVGAAWVASALWDRRTTPARLAVGLMLAGLTFEAGLAVARSRHGLGVAIGRESAEAYLSRREPTFVVGRWIDAHLPRDARVVGQDHRGFYLARPYAMELAHRRRTGLGTSGEGPELVVDRLRSAGFTHLLLCPPVPENAVEFDPTLGRLLGPWLDRARPLYRADLGDADGVIRRYAIYDIRPGPDAVARSGREPAR